MNGNTVSEQNSSLAHMTAGGSMLSVKPETNNELKTIDSLQFYLQTAPVESASVTGATNLLQNFELNWAYNKFSNKKVKQPLSSFISHLPGPVDTPAIEDDSGLLGLLDRPGMVLKEIKPLTGAQLTGFRLYPGPIPEQYKVPLLHETHTMKAKKHKKKKSKKHRHHSEEFEFNSSMHSSNLNLASAANFSGKLNNQQSSFLTASTSNLSSSTSKSGFKASSSFTSVSQQPNSPTGNEETSAPAATTGGGVKADDQKRNRKRVYDDKKKKKDKKKKRKKEVLSD